MNKKLWLILILSLIACMSLQAIPVYRMGVFLPVSGEQARMGQDIQEGMEVFLDYIKNAGGFQSFLLRTVIFDTESSPGNTDKIVEILSKGAADTFSLLAGGIDQKGFVQIQKLSETQGIPYLFPFSVSFREQPSKHTFPLLPSLYSGFKFIFRFFSERNLEVKIVYDDSTRDQAFVLAGPELLIHYKDGALKTNPPKVAVIFVEDSKVEEVLSQTQGLSFRVLNYHQSNLIARSADKTLWEDTLLLNWVKPETHDTVKFFQETFEAQKKKKPNNFNMLGWILADMAYETLLRATGKKNGEAARAEIIAELENFGERGGYDGGCGYNIYYTPFKTGDAFSRMGISGFYFMKYTQGSFELISDFYSLVLP